MGRIPIVAMIVVVLFVGCDKGSQSSARLPGSGAWKDAISYRLGIDRGRTNQGYMDGARKSTIPTAFLIGPTGKIAWIGNAARIEQPLSELLHTGQVSEGLLEPAEPGASLGVGDPAPSLDVGRWMLGEPISDFVSGHVYVIDFWATWCGPCLRTIPHLSDLQSQYADRITVIGITDESEREVREFLQSHPNR
ncbi:MAG: TlpA disulfide reductase family protein [Planctomycetota bacterium]|nr:TlpA disulfide reductase family protein [Planctomycetota bacterium]MDA1180059.1 TlpA disulfide reductase family protein [Planctomycetota bacterium]